MMHNAGHVVTVYNYWLISEAWSDAEVSTAKASLEKIEQELGMKALLGTAQEVEASDLDGEGYYRRVATGWMDLPLN